MFRDNGLGTRDYALLTPDRATITVCKEADSLLIDVKLARFHFFDVITSYITWLCNFLKIILFHASR